MNKLILILISFFQLNLFAMSPETPEQAVQAKYEVNSSSSYSKLKTALNQAIADLEADETDSTAYFSLGAIYEWVAIEERFKLNLDLFLQPQGSLFMGGALGIKELLHAGQIPSTTIKQQIADLLWTKLGSLQPNSGENKDLAHAAVEVLILLEDDRGLEAILTDSDYIKNLRAIDEWNQDSDASTFATLSQNYENQNGQNSEAKHLTAFYDLCRLRKISGATKIESISSVIDLSQY